jgi:hypothetical protein
LSIAAGLIASIVATTAPGPIMLDARCDEAAWQSAARTDIGGGLSLLSMADAEYVYLCIPLPAESFGSLDLYIAEPSGALTDLHVSAQTGERTRGAEGWPEWRGFNNYRGWYGPPVAFNGYAANGDVDFAFSPARELQLSRARFGAGPWRIMLEVDAVAPDNRKVTFPADATADNTASWVEFSAP